MTFATADILRTPYKLGGRTVGSELDCLGTVAEIARRRGLPPPGGWPEILSAVEAGRTANGFPLGWRRVPDPVRLLDGDVLVLPGEHPGCAIVHEGRVFTARPEAGVHAVPLHRWSQAPSEVWRFSA
tara:strand:+ start:18078 stop:18458 length:381 start_codon:yes stop_codon:yes gene_type:complete